MHWFLNTKIKILSALHTHTFRHMAHLAANIDMSYGIVRRKVLELEAMGLCKTWQITPTDADNKYKFTQIKLTQYGIKMAGLCKDLEDAVYEYEERTGVN